MVVAICGILIVLITVGLIEHAGVTFIACIYPLYRTSMVMVYATKILNENENKPDDKQRWLTFWLAFGFMTFYDPILRFILGFVPLYYLLKLFLYVSLMHPRIDLAMQLFNGVIKPRITKVEPIRKELSRHICTQSMHTCKCFLCFWNRSYITKC
jgi:hypothetical protein